MVFGHDWLALVVFIGGLSAATGMIVVETIALSTMVCNDLVMPLLLRYRWLALQGQEDVSGLLLGIRRGAIVLILLLAYLYFRLAGEAHALVSIGLISFAAVAQFAPAMLGGMYWRGGTRAGAVAGLSSGFAVWLYTLLLPSFAKSGWLPGDFLQNGLFGLDLLRPQELFGMQGLDPLAHSLFWSMLANLGAYVWVSLMRQPTAIEAGQATLFVDVFKQGRPSDGAFWRGSARVGDLLPLLGRFLGRIHAVGGRRLFAGRPTLDIASFGEQPRDEILHSAFLPAELREPWHTVVDQALASVRRCYERAGALPQLRLHGDCHAGNVLWTDAGPHFVDFDDARNGPAIQDLWMLLSGDTPAMARQLDHVLEGYEQFADFDTKSLHLVEALRTLRLIHYAGWIAKRWSDPAFPAAFGWFDTPRYWQDQILALREQIALMDESPLVQQF